MIQYPHYTLYRLTIHISVGENSVVSSLARSYLETFSYIFQCVSLAQCRNLTFLNNFDKSQLLYQAVANIIFQCVIFTIKDYRVIAMISSRIPLLRSSVCLYQPYLTRLGLHVRFNSTKNPFLYSNTYKDLNQRVQSVFGNPETTINSGENDALITDVLSACRQIHALSYPISDIDKDSKPVKEMMEIIDIVFSNASVTFSADLLRRLFLLRLPSSVSLHLINTFYTKNPDAVISKETSLIALRTSLWNADFQNSIKISDVTVGHPNYIAQQNQLLRSGVAKLFTTSILITLLTKFGVQQAIDLGWITSTWKHLGSINSMILTYIINSSFFVTIVRFGRQLISSGGDYLTWQKGTFYTHWFRHADEMLFCSKIVEADRSLNLGESNPQIINELCRTNDDIFTQHTLRPGYTRDGEKIRLLEEKDNLEDLKLQAYWMSGGDGFEWVEPDQDPAEILWHQHLNQFNNPALNGTTGTKSLKWADELIDKE